MAQDIAIIWNGVEQTGDIQYKDGDLIREDGLTTAVLLSLFLDSRANDDSGISDPDKKRGWWGDLIDPAFEGVGLGSNLWLLSREKVTKTTLNLTEQYIRDALAWMIADGVVTKIDVEVEALGSIETPVLAAAITLHFADGETEVIKFKDLWDAQFADNYYLTRGT